MSCICNDMAMVAFRGYALSYRLCSTSAPPRLRVNLIVFFFFRGLCALSWQKISLFFLPHELGNKTKDIFLLTRGRRDAEKRDRDKTDY